MIRVAKELYSKYRHGTIILLYMIFYMAAFRFLEDRHVYMYHVVHTFIDDYIPFCEVFIIPYMLWFPFIAATMLWFIFRCPDRSEYYRLTANLIMGMTIFLIVSYAYPNMQELRPHVFARDNVFTDMVGWLYRTDTPTNILPSIHVFNSLACCMAVFNSPSLVRFTRTRQATLALTILIVLSTMFLKQHSFVDVCLGSAMACFGYLLFYTQEDAAQEQALAVAGSIKGRRS